MCACISYLTTNLCIFGYLILGLACLKNCKNFGIRIFRGLLSASLSNCSAESSHIFCKAPNAPQNNKKETIKCFEIIWCKINLKCCHFNNTDFWIRKIFNFPIFLQVIARHNLQTSFVFQPSHYPRVQQKISIGRGCIVVSRNCGGNFDHFK